MDDRRPVWDEIGANRLKSFLLMVLFGVLVGGMGWAFGELTGAGSYGILVSLAFAAVAAFSTYWYSDRIVLAASRAQPIDPVKHRQLLNAVEGLAIAAGLPAPRVFVIDDSAPNAFATGRDPAHAAIAVTTGLLDKLDRLELEGVLAHEMSHIANFDIRMTTLAGVMVGSVALLADWMFRSLRWGMWGGRGDRRSGAALPLMVVAIVLAILAPIAAELLRMAVSRQREYLADANGALLTRFPEGLARALEKLHADPEPLEVANRATAPLYIVNPLTEHKGSRASLFDTHPPIDERIRRLRAM
jgi:heat shock protein HtpX